MEQDVRRDACARVQSDRTLTGQGTLGLELSRQAPELDTVLVAVGGGGLIGRHCHVVRIEAARHRCGAGGRADVGGGAEGRQAGGRADRQRRG